MKRRAGALFCALMLLLPLFPGRAAAAENLYFTAVNETILELSDATMPFWSGGYLYVPGSMFSGGEVGLSYSYNRYKQRAVIWVTGTPADALIFRLDEDMVWDGQGNNYSPTAISRGAQVFVPVSVVTQFFGLTYSNSKISHGYLVRVRTASSVLPDAALIDAGASQLESRYTQYLQSLTQEGQTSAGQTETPAGGKKSIHLCLRVTDSESAAGLLDALGERAYLTFYLTEAQIRVSGDLLRRLAGTGHAAGLLVYGGSETSIARQLSSANEALFAATGGKTRLCRVEGGSQAELDEAESAGYRCLRADVDRAGRGLLGAVSARALAALTDGQRGDLTVWLSDNVSAAGLRAFLSAAPEGDRLTALTEMN